MIRILKTLVQVRVTMISFSLMAMLIVAAFPPAMGAGQKRPNAESETPIFSDYRGVHIGMTADEARQKLGKPKDQGDTQDYFAITDNESATIVYDATQHKVVTVSIDYSSGAAGVPVAKAVLGSDIEAKPDGSLYKMVRYPKAGYWVSYFKAAGDSPMTSITIQKID